MRQCVSADDTSVCFPIRTQFSVITSSRSSAFACQSLFYRFAFPGTASVNYLFTNRTNTIRSQYLYCFRFDSHIRLLFGLDCHRTKCVSIELDFHSRRISISKEKRDSAFPLQSERFSVSARNANEVVRFGKRRVSRPHRLEEQRFCFCRFNKNANQNLNP